MEHRVGLIFFNLGNFEENVNKCGHLKPRHTQMRKSGRSLAIFMLFSFPVHMSDSPLNQKRGFSSGKTLCHILFPVQIHSEDFTGSLFSFSVGFFGHFTIIIK